MLRKDICSIIALAGLVLVSCTDNRIIDNSIVTNNFDGKSTPVSGSWVVSESKWNGSLSDLPEPRAQKIYSDKHVMYTYYDSKNPGGPVLVGAGTYEFEDGVVTEVISNHSNKALIGSKFTLDISMSEDGRSFKQTVMLGENRLEETWERQD